MISWLLVALLGCRGALDLPPAPEVDPTTRWGAALSEVVAHDGTVDLDALAEARPELEAYLAWQAHPETVDVKGRQAYAHWLNVHNALALYLLLTAGDPTAVDPLAGLRWGRTVSLGGRQHSLHELFHERLRLYQLDPRILAAAVCFTPGCPPARGDLYHSGILTRQLDDQMGRWLDDAVRLDPDAVRVSPRLDRFHRDVTAWTGAPDLCAGLATYADAATRDALLERSAAGCRWEAMR